MGSILASAAFALFFNGFALAGLHVPGIGWRGLFILGATAGAAGVLCAGAGGGVAGVAGGGEEAARRGLPERSAGEARDLGAA